MIKALKSGYYELGRYSSSGRGYLDEAKLCFGWRNRHNKYHNREELHRAEDIVDGRAVERREERRSDRNASYGTLPSYRTDGSGGELPCYRSGDEIGRAGIMM